MMRKPVLQMLLTLMMLCGVSYAQEREVVKWGEPAYSCLVWNEYSGKPLFIREETCVSQLSNQIIYRDRGLTVSLLQPLSVVGGNQSKQFIWWVTIESQGVQQMVYFRSDDKGLFVDSRLAIRLQDLGKLKLIETSSGTRLLYTAADDGQWRLVSLTNGSGEHLLIDYGPRGEVQRIRDDSSRQARLEYEANKIGAVIQTWYQSGSKYLTTATFK